jgi:hypothetical protein
MEQRAQDLQKAVDESEVSVGERTRFYGKAGMAVVPFPTS